MSYTVAVYSEWRKEHLQNTGLSGCDGNGLRMIHPPKTQGKNRKAQTTPAGFTPLIFDASVLEVGVRGVGVVARRTLMCL
jgi:hypothetical protein